MQVGIFWDLDGTLLNTLEDLQDAVNHILQRYGLPVRDGMQIRSFLGNGAKDLIHRALEGAPETLDESSVLQDYLDYYNAHSQIKTGPYAGIPEALEELGRQYPMAVVSNKPDPAVKLLGRTYFPSLYALGEKQDCPRKPAPDMVLRAMEALGVTRGIYVGDSEVDIQTAENAGMPCISVLWGFRDRSLLEAAGAQYLCEVPAQLPQLVERIMKEVYGE